MPGKTALLLIDLQQEMALRIAGGRVPFPGGAEARVADLVALFRARGLPVIHVHHHDPDPASPFRREKASGATMPCAARQGEEAVFWKAGSSAFSGTGLDAHLRRNGIDRIVVAGAVAAFCVTSSVRAAADLGFRVVLVEDALIGFDIPGHDGSGLIGAAEVMRVTLALLAADFAQVVPGAGVAALI